MDVYQYNAMTMRRIYVLAISESAFRLLSIIFRLDPSIDVDLFFQMINTMMTTIAMTTHTATMLMVVVVGLICELGAVATHMHANSTT